VRNLFIPLSVGLLCTSFTMIPAVQTATRTAAVAIAHIDEASSVYNTIQLDQYGLSKEAFTYAWTGYQRLLERKMINRTNYLTICDLSQSSRKKRLYIIDVINNKLVINTYVAHGKNSGGEYADRFSNQPESLQSSLGFYITADTYIGAGL